MLLILTALSGLPKHVLNLCISSNPQDNPEGGAEMSQMEPGPLQHWMLPRPYQGSQGTQAPNSPSHPPLPLTHVTQPNLFLVLSKISLATQSRPKSQCFIHLGGQMPGSVHENMPL